MASLPLVQRYPCLSARAGRLMTAGPLDYALAVSDAAAALPIIGKHLEPLGALTAAGAWVHRNGPASAALLAGASRQLRQRNADTPEPAPLQALASAALAALVPPETLTTPWPDPPRLAPFLHAGGLRRRYLYRSGVRYGPAPQQVLDVWRRRDLPQGRPAPVLVFVPGGGWLHGGRQVQGHTLMAHLAQHGWVCLSVQHRVAPRHRWPRHIRDVRAALAWARAHVDDVGGDPRFVGVAGCSSGAHLAALTGLTPHDHDFDAELGANADTSVDAVVSLYGRYDWTDRSTPDRDEFVRFIENLVVRQTMHRHREIFDNASPITRVHPDAPPFLVIHGDADHVIPVEEARAFVDALRSVSRSPVGYLQIPGAGHGFDLTDRWSTQAAVNATSQFLQTVHHNHPTGAHDQQAAV